MNLEIANYNIQVMNLPSDIIKSPYLKQVIKMFPVIDKTIKSIINIVLVPKVEIPINLSPRAEAKYGEQNDQIYISSKYFDLTFNLSNQECYLKLFEIKPKTFYLLKAIKLILSIIVIRDGGLPFHCSAISNGETGYVFTGKSGSGKTTAAVLLSLNEFSILNDEFNIIFPRESGFLIYSTPFTTENKLKVCNNINSNINKIFFVNQSNSNYKVLDLKHLNFAMFLSSIYSFPTTKSLTDKMLKTAEILYRNVAPELLYFINNNSFTNDFNRILQ